MAINGIRFRKEVSRAPPPLPPSCCALLPGSGPCPSRGWLNIRGVARRSASSLVGTHRRDRFGSKRVQIPLHWPRVRVPAPPGFSVPFARCTGGRAARSPAVHWPPFTMESILFGRVHTAAPAAPAAHHGPGQGWTGLGWADVFTRHVSPCTYWMQVGDGALFAQSFNGRVSIEIIWKN